MVECFRKITNCGWLNVLIKLKSNVLMMNLRKGFFQWLRNSCWLVPRCNIINYRDQVDDDVEDNVDDDVDDDVDDEVECDVDDYVDDDVHDDVECNVDDDFDNDVEDNVDTGGHPERRWMHSCLLRCAWPPSSGHYCHVMSLSST